MRTQVVNLFGAPGSGKSTTRAGLFHLLKLAGYSVEEVTEYAKDLTWSERYNELYCQPYVHGKQLRNTERLISKVDYVITDSPLALSGFYNWKYHAGTYGKSFTDFVMENFDTFHNLNIFLERDKPYSANGRNETEEESNIMSEEIKTFLDYYSISYTLMKGNEETPLAILKEIENAKSRW